MSVVVVKLRTLKFVNSIGDGQFVQSELFFDVGKVRH